MNKIFVVVFATFLWIVSLVQGTGLGNAINITEKAQYILGAITIALILRQHINRKVEVKFFCSILVVIICFILLPYFFKGKLLGMGYMLVFLSTFILANFKINDTCIRWISLIYGLLGIIFLLIYNKTNILSGWNENSIAMIGFFSYSVFTMGFMFSRKKSDRIFTVVVMGLYLYLLNITDSRSSTLFVVISFFFILNIIKVEKLYSKKLYKLFLHVPLMVAFVGIIIPGLPFYEKLNLWSYVEFKKPLLNGRNDIWLQGFKQLIKTPIFGSGELINGWHNSAITCLASYGIIGYTAWIAIFLYIFELAHEHLKDKFVCAIITAFLLIYLQQSVELGLIATEPNYIPYIILGVLLGRIKYLKSVEER